MHVQGIGTSYVHIWVMSECVLIKKFCTDVYMKLRIETKVCGLKNVNNIPE